MGEVKEKPGEVSLAVSRPVDAGEGPKPDPFQSSSILSAYADAVGAGHPECDHPRDHAVGVLECLWDHGLVIVKSADYLRSRPIVGWTLAALATVVGFVSGTVVSAAG